MSGHTIDAAGYDKTFSYIYDANGNILEISDGTNVIKYTYDKANQLIREDNQAADYIHIWTYDDAGNIVSRKEYAYTTEALGTATSTANYVYGNSNWGDLLTSYNGQAITHDNIGNPLSDGRRTYTWKHGRQLATLTQAGSTWSFTYNADGLRTKRTNGSTTYNYVYNGSSLSQMTVGDHQLNFMYDASGAPMAVIYNGTTYYYATNMQGDVIAILDGSGNAVVQYMYDAWGKLLSTTGSMATTLGVHNPLRYRGYVYDPETGLYYVSSRYYDPEIGRWINADDTAYLGADGTLLSYNLFAYCKNNPVMGYDPTGHFGPVGAIIATGAIVGGLLGAFSAATTGGNVLESAIEGCLTGALGATCGLLIPSSGLAVVAAAAGGAVIDFATQATTQYIQNKSVNLSYIDGWRVAKTAVQTGIGTAVPKFGQGAENAVDAFGTALIWAETSALIVCADIATTNTIAAVKTSSSGASRNHRSVAITGQEMLLK